MAALPAPVVPDIAMLPAVKEVLAPPQRDCMPPDRCTNIPNPINATSAVSRQYSARSCPVSSRQMPCKNPVTFFITSTKISLGQYPLPDYPLFRYGSKITDSTSV